MPSTITLKAITLTVTLVGMAVGAIVWANSAHQDISSSCEHRIHLESSSIIERSDSLYSRREDMSRIEQSLINQDEEIEEINHKLDILLDSL